MRKPIFPLTIILFLLPPICFVALRVHHSTRGAVVSVPQPHDRVGREAPESCLVTKPPAHPFVPPSPYPAETGTDSFWFGTVKLWTSLPTDGTWRGLPHYTSDDPTFRQKLFFWRQGYRSELPPQLRVTG
jgi:hypothetical protein